MINQEEVSEFIFREIPGLEAEAAREKNTVYSLMHSLINYTNQQLNQQNYHLVSKCFSVVDRLYTDGNSVIRCAVENVYIYALDRTLMAYRCNRDKLYAMLPAGLYRAYVGQMISSNI